MTGERFKQVEEVEPITFATDAREVALAAYDRMLSLLERLGPEEWGARTECPAWDVGDMVGHLIGAGEANASFRQLLRQQLWAVRHKGEFGGNDLDACNALQVRDHADMTPEERIAALRAIAPKAVAGRMRFPRPLRKISVPVPGGGSTAAGMPPSLSLGHLMAVIYTHDVWLHRVDVARATGRPLELDRELDGRIVEDAVAEWAARHGQPFRLTLGGIAGGGFRQGEGGPDLELDAVEFCRTLSGRVSGEGLLETRILF